MTEQMHCPICDEERMRLREEYAGNLIDLQEELCESLAAVIGAHERGEHGDD